MRKKLLLSILIVAISLLSVTAQSDKYTTDTLSMYPGYSNDIFYSMANGEIANVSRAGWDIAFYTAAFSAGIIINEGSGVDLYSYPYGDTAAWSSVDTAGISTWTKLYNSQEYWEDGAFNRNATGHPDYGWGIYNMVTHSLTSDSIYVIKANDGSFKKLWIVNKISVDNLYNIKYADLDGANEQVVSVDINPYGSKRFIYYSLVTNELIDREPSASWDLLFTKYVDFTETQSGEMVEYLVTGATSNVDHFANKFYPVAENFEDWTSKPLDSLKNSVGYNWKNFNMSTFQWVVEDSTAFFVMNKAGDVYKLVFTYWQGSSTGVFAMDTKLITLSDIDDIVSTNNILSVYPNPANETINISVLSDYKIDANLVICDISGREVFNSLINSSKSINVSDFTNGIYFITIYNNEFRETQKLIIR